MQVKIDLFSSEPDPFSLKYGFMVRRNLLLSVMCFNFKFSKYNFFSLGGLHSNFRFLKMPQVLPQVCRGSEHGTDVYARVTQSPDYV